MTDEQIRDIIEWDVVNWSRCLPLWQQALNGTDGPLKCLELGGNHGGPSLWLALQGHEVICSDLEEPGEEARALHGKYGMAERIRYAAIDGLNIPYDQAFDVIIFKSILGGIARGGQDEKKRQVMKQIHKALKPGGKLLFAENLAGSWLHRFTRKHFVKWGAEWNYLKYQDVQALLSDFNEIELRTHGFLGAFGRTEKQRGSLGKLDRVIAPLIPPAARYIVVGTCVK